MKDNIMVIEYTISLGDKEETRFVMYNEKVITEEEVNKLINNGMVIYDERVIPMSQKQWEFLKTV